MPFTTEPERYPKAVWKGDGKSGGEYTSGPWKLVIHTTETAQNGVPGYNSGWTAPHITYVPAWRRFYQHTSFGVAARALRNESGGVQTNRDQAIQLEIVCYSAKNIADAATYRQWVGDLSAEQLEDIRQFVRWVSIEFGVRLEWPGRQAYSYSEANAPGFRVTQREWDAGNGVFGHQHIPEQTHWDPGALNWAAIVGDASPTEEDYTLFRINRGDGAPDQKPEKVYDIRYYQYRLEFLGYEITKVDGEYPGVADQETLDAIFDFVGSPEGGSYFSAEEGAIFEKRWVMAFATPGPQGEEGPRGVRGKRGPQGEPGPAGDNATLDPGTILVVTENG